MMGFLAYNQLMEADAEVRHLETDTWHAGGGHVGKTHTYEVGHPSIEGKMHVQVSTFSGQPGRAEVDSIHPEDESGLHTAWHQNRGKVGAHAVRKAARHIADHLGVKSLYGWRSTGATSRNPDPEREQEIRFR